MVKTVYEAWNFGLSKVTNNYFCILTSDDLWEHNWLDIAINSLKYNPNCICAAATTKLLNSNSEWGNKATFTSIGDRFFMTTENSPQLRNGLVNSLAHYFIGPLHTSIHSLLMRSTILYQGEKFAEDLGSAADYEWYIKLGFYGDILYLPNVSVGWRIYAGQVTKQAEQECTGNFVKKIHCRMRDKIAQRLGTIGKEFIVMADDYDRTILTYHYARPYLVNIFSKPFTEIPRLIKLMFTMPREFFYDFLFRVRGKYFFLEESLRRAKKFYSLMDY